MCQDAPTAVDPQPAAPQPEVARPGFMARYKQLLTDYGPLALVVYLVIFASVWGGAALAISAGVDMAGLFRWLGIEAGASLGPVMLGYGFAKATQVLRVLATLALTPLVARWIGFQPASPPVEEPPPASP